MQTFGDFIALLIIGWSIDLIQSNSNT